MIRIGFPQGLLYYDYYPFWEAFLTKLDLQVIKSSKTNKEILNLGIATSVDEACLPVKIYHGHVEYLKDKVDYILIPRYYSLNKKEYGCPKHLGIANMIEHSIDSLPKLLTPKIDNNRSNGLRTAAIETGKLFTNKISLLNKAYVAGVEAQKTQLEWVRSEIDYNMEKQRDNYELNKIRILILGHGYNIYDNFVNMNLISKLAKVDFELVFPDEISQADITKSTDKLSKRMFWSNGRKVVGSAYSLLDNKTIDGIVYVSAFGCGLDSVLMYLVESRANDENIPMMSMTFDEQTGEAGFNTRIEAFIDMVKWRYSLEDNISTFR